MLDPKYVREHKEEVRRNVLERRVDVDMDAWLVLDEERSCELQRIEQKRHERHEVAERVKDASQVERVTLIDRAKQLKEWLAVNEKNFEELNNRWQDGLMCFPNQTHQDTPKGVSDEENTVLREVGKVAQLSFLPMSHVDLAKRHSLIDFERAAKVAGTKFYYLQGKLALLEQALIRYAMDVMVREGYTLLTTPDLAREEVLIGKGFLPRGPETQVYYVEGQDLALVGTAEITVLGYHMNETLVAEELPKKYAAFSHCFRTEGGAYGRESYGLYRVHQFSKVEMFAFASPPQSEAVHLEFLRIEEYFWQSLGIPYRVVDCCVGDLGGSDYRRYDLEAWMWGKGEGKGGWGEVTSTSNCLDYQARGLQIKYEDREGERGFVHTLNGTVVATPRAIIAIMENFQQADGSMVIPEVLRPYCGFEKIG